MVKLSVSFAMREAVPALNNQSRARCYCFPVLYLCCCRFECCKAKLLKRSSSFFIRWVMSVTSSLSQQYQQKERCLLRAPSLRRRASIPAEEQGRRGRGAEGFPSGFCDRENTVVHLSAQPSQLQSRWVTDKHLTPSVSDLCQWNCASPVARDRWPQRRRQDYPGLLPFRQPAASPPGRLTYPGERHRTQLCIT